MNITVNKKHNIYSVLVKKISLSPFNDKGYTADDKVTSYDYGMCVNLYKMFLNERCTPKMNSE